MSSQTTKFKKGDRVYRTFEVPGILPLGLGGVVQTDPHEQQRYDLDGTMGVFIHYDNGIKTWSRDSSNDFQPLFPDKS